MTTPEQIQRDIEGTRAALSTDVDRLAEKVSPGQIVSRRVGRVKSGVTSVRERVMGSAPSYGSSQGHASSVAGSAKDAAGSVADSAKNVAGSVQDAVTGAPQAVRQQTRGNPMGAGMVAFGLGLVISSLIPATDKEKQLAAKAEDVAREPLQEKAKEVASELQSSASESAQQLKETVSQAASNTADQARSSAEDVKAPLQK